MTKLSAGLALAAMMSAASATSVTYAVTPEGGPTLQYDFTVTNDTVGSSIVQFNLFFDWATVTNINPQSQPADFAGPLVAVPSPGYDGYVNYYASDAGIAVGASATGFVVNVDFTGAGTPLDPTFQILDANFTVLDSGTATAGQVASVPEPGSLGLAALAIAAVGAMRRRMTRR